VPGFAPAWSPDGKRLAVGASGIDVYEVGSNRPSLALKHCYTYMVSSLSWSADGRTLLAASNGTVRRWDATTGQPGKVLLQLEGDDYLYLTPDGDYRGSAGVEEHLVFVVQKENGGQETLPAREFTEKYGWLNHSDKVRRQP
jgi:WD40 repeat protein